MQVEEKLEHCPKCETDLSLHHNVSSMPSFCIHCKFPLMLVAGKYRFLQVVGQGAVGTVYLARHTKLRHNADRVVKVIKEEMLKASTTVQRFFREVQVTAELSESNDHIVRIYDDFGELPHLGYFYVMEFIRGVSLRQYIRQQKYLPDLQWCVDLMGQLSDALHTAHKAGVIHRDLKPDNMMLTHKGAHQSYLKVLDWGIAKPLGDELDMNLTQGLVGTPHYMAPEQALNQEIDVRTDIYSMAIIFYELLTGINPFVAATGKKGRSHDSMVDLINAHIHQTPPSIQEVMPERKDVTPELEAVIFKALSKNPKNRYKSVLEFWSAIQQITGLTNTTPISHISASVNSKDHLLPPAISNLGQITNIDHFKTPVPTGQYAGSSPSRPDTQEPVKIQRSSTDALKISQQDSWQETIFHSSVPKNKKRWSGLAGVLVLLLALGTGGWALLQQSASQKKANSQRTSPPPRTRPQKQPVALRKTEGPPKRTPAVSPPALANSNSNNNNSDNSDDSDDSDDSKELKPPTRQRLARPRKRARRRRRRRRSRRRRRVRTRRPTNRVLQERATPAVRRPSSPCPSGWKAIRVRPFLSTSAEITAEGGKWKRISSRMVCLSSKTKRLSIVQEGYELCIFRVPKRSTVRVRLLSAGRGGISASNCLRR